MSLAFIASRFLFLAGKIETPQRVSNDLARIAFRIAAAPINFAMGLHAPWKHRMTGNCNILFSLQAHGLPRRTRLGRASALFLQASFVRRPSLRALSFLILGCCGLFAPAMPALAQQVSREQDIGELRLGQRIKVDDGTCPAGQIKEISGTKMTLTGIVRSQKCIPRLGPKQK